MSLNLPNRSEIEQQIINAILIFEDFDKTATKYSNNYLTLENTLLSLSVQDYGPELNGAISQLRARVNALIFPSTVRSVLDPLFRTYARVIGSPATDADTAIIDIYKYYVSQGYEVLSRGMSLGSVSSITGSGTGIVNRLTIDESGYTFENVTPETKKIECIQDASSGVAQHEELFLITGSPVGRDLLDLSDGGGSGVAAQLAAYSARQSLARNPSFSSYSGTAAVPTAITNWTASAIGNFALDAVNYYRDSFGDTVPVALKFVTNASVTQVLADNSIVINPNRPYYLQVAYNRSIGSGDGNLTITLGNTTKTVALVAQSGWQILRLDLDKNVWFKNWNKQDPTVKIEISSRTTGYTLVDDVLLCQMVYVDGLYYTIVGGATPFLRAEYFTVTDTDGSTTGDGLINKWLWRGYNRYLPHTASVSSSAWQGDGI